MTKINGFDQSALVAPAPPFFLYLLVYGLARLIWQTLKKCLHYNDLLFSLFLKNLTLPIFAPDMYKKINTLGFGDCMRGFEVYVRHREITTRPA
jgi:hypothetical protein